MTSAAPASPHPALSTRVLVGTQKGLFLVDAGDAAGEPWHITGPLLEGQEVLHAWLDPRRSGRAYAAVNHLVWGAHLYRSDDWGLTWSALPSAPQHPEGRFPTALRAVWQLAPGASDHPDSLYAGIDPAGLFASRDGGKHWEPVDGLNTHPTRSTWEPSKGGFSLHSIHACAADGPAAGRLYAAVSAGGAYRSDDSGRSWRPINAGVDARHLPGGEARSGHNVHKVVVSRCDPDRLYRQCYGGVYRSDDGGEHWQGIAAGLPSDFGYALATDPGERDTVWVIPIASNHLRTTPEGRLRVYRSRDAGNRWECLHAGLPQRHVYVSVLREALCLDPVDSRNAWFGTSGGHLFGSTGQGRQWQLVAGFLPRILSVSAGRVPLADSPAERAD
jgi:photosystem II stability/assembly factor-like uncharacterized protein